MIVRRRATFVAALALALLPLAGCGSDGGGSSASAGLPAAQLSSLATGAAEDAAALRGPAVVNLWATWCGPCRKELPAFQAVHDDLGSSVRFIGINQGDDAAAVTEYLAQVGVSFDQYLDTDGALSDGLAITGLPATAFIAADGTVLGVHSGELSEDELRQLIDEQFATT